MGLTAAAGFGKFAIDKRRKVNTIWMYPLSEMLSEFLQVDGRMWLLKRKLICILKGALFCVSWILRKCTDYFFLILLNLFLWIECRVLSGIQFKTKQKTSEPKYWQASLVYVGWDSRFCALVIQGSTWDFLLQHRVRCRWRSFCGLRGSTHPCDVWEWHPAAFSSHSLTVWIPSVFVGKSLWRILGEWVLYNSLGSFVSEVFHGIRILTSFYCALSFPFVKGTRLKVL